ncbi:hypothetical protein GCM10010977_31850 [Citricoccus zhacaiensis]|uniref:TRAP transporter large permease subunit n=1 Tax=Citricoccus zhacaiensis TaxID=489142 RepID=A0ABQ2MC88_9MICC|nr:TRAP transporter large permease subunit [Citricoccus zhacaiensis]GGO49591.1 hypothetical protein GCM10010977_31850 [Citricoccus zhacaiensis]
MTPNGVTQQLTGQRTASTHDQDGVMGHPDADDLVVMPTSEPKQPGMGGTWLTRVAHLISKIGGQVAGVLTMILGLLIVADVVMRLLHQPITGVLEITQYALMPLLVFLSLAFAQSIGEHIRATILVDRLGPKDALVANLTAQAISLVATVTLAVAAVASASFATEIQLVALGAVEIPVWPVKILVALGLILLAVQIVATMVDMVIAGRVDPESVLVERRVSTELKSAQNIEAPAAEIASRRLMIGAVVVMLALMVLVLFGPVGDLTIGILVIALSIVLMLAGIPIGFAILIPAAVGLWRMSGFNAVLVSFEDIPFDTTASWSLSVIPMFILMGTVMGRFQLTARLFEAAKAWMGGLPGGLAISTNFAGAGLAAASGSSMAITYSLGRVAIPEMLKAGYKPKLATGSVAMSGTLGMLIPPSVVLVVYASTAGTAVGPQLTAAVLPGVVLAIAFSVVILLWSLADKKLAPKAAGGSVSWTHRFRTLPGVIPMTVIILAIIGGMFSGLFTPTEAGAVGALLAIVMGWAFSDDRSWKTFWPRMIDSLKETVAGVAPIFLLLIGVHVLTRVVALSGLAEALAEWVQSIGLTRTMLLLLLIPVFILMGMFMDSLAMILLTVPVLAPVLTALDVDLIWYGIFMVILVELGMVTPPIGILSYIVHRVSQNPEVNAGTPVSLIDVFKGVGPFLLAGIAMLVFIIFVPEFVLLGATGGS